ncbi:hypothetical protein LJR220_004461 [Bradyrhizobium sp. LjRoot220]|uniref:hypothetical protein n=1 Tax=Bradyrhizobium sp. LjRoot220 TaxID=3342284 RepID=UPI003ECD1061
MDALPMALLAFTAGFLTCALLVAVLIRWSFSDRRDRGSEPVASNEQKPRAIDFLWSGR